MGWVCVRKGGPSLAVPSPPAAGTFYFSSRLERAPANCHICLLNLRRNEVLVSGNQQSDLPGLLYFAAGPMSDPELLYRRKAVSPSEDPRDVCRDGGDQQVQHRGSKKWVKSTGRHAGSQQWQALLNAMFPSSCYHP